MVTNESICDCPHMQPHARFLQPPPFFYHSCMVHSPEICRLDHLEREALEGILWPSAGVAFRSSFCDS